MHVIEGRCVICRLGYVTQEMGRRILGSLLCFGLLAPFTDFSVATTRTSRLSDSRLLRKWSVALGFAQVQTVDCFSARFLSLGDTLEDRTITTISSLGFFHFFQPLYNTTPLQSSSDSLSRHSSTSTSTTITSTIHSYRILRTTFTLILLQTTHIHTHSQLRSTLLKPPTCPRSSRPKTSPF